MEITYSVVSQENNVFVFIFSPSFIMSSNNVSRAYSLGSSIYLEMKRNTYELSCNNTLVNGDKFKLRDMLIFYNKIFMS